MISNTSAFKTLSRSPSKRKQNFQEDGDDKDVYVESILRQQGLLSLLVFANLSGYWKTLHIKHLLLD